MPPSPPAEKSKKHAPSPACGEGWGGGNRSQSGSAYGNSPKPGVVALPPPNRKLPKPAPARLSSRTCW